MTGKGLKNWRKSMKLSQETLAGLLGKGRRTVQDWEASDEPLDRAIEYAIRWLDHCLGLGKHPDQI